MIYGKPYFLYFFAHHLLDQNSPSPWVKNWKLGTGMAKIAKIEFSLFLVNKLVNCKRQDFHFFRHQNLDGS